MKLLNFPIIKLTFCLVLGIGIGYLIKIPLHASIATTTLLLAILFALYLISRKQFFKSVWFGTITYLVTISLGILTTNFHNPKNFYSHYTNIISKDNNPTLTITFKIREVLKPSAYHNKYVVDLLQINTYKVTGKTLLNIKKGSLKSTLKIDDVFISRTNFTNVNNPLNPHQFNYKNYLDKKYIYHQIFATKAQLLSVKSSTKTLLGFANNIRQHINKKLKPYRFKPDEISIINALLLGQRQDISEDVYTNYTNAGAIHILAVSGLHVGIILLILNYIFKPLERLKYGIIIKTLLLVSILWGFALIAGLSASVTRAVTMFSIVALALNLNRPTNIYNTLAISMFFILLFKPLFLFDVGFQLSYLAVFAIVSIDPLLYKLWKPKYWILNKLWHTFTVTISAQLGILPLSLFYFHQFPGLFFISNLVIIPLLGIILGLGILVILLALINVLPQIGADIYGHIISYMNGFIGWVAKQEAFILHDIPFNFLQVLATYLMIICFLKLFIKRNYKNLKLFLITIFIIQGVFIFNKFNRAPNEFIVFHKSRFSLLANKTNNMLIVADDFDSITKKTNTLITNYSVGNNINKIKNETISSLYQFNNNYLLVIDSLNTYNLSSLKPRYVLLRQSPKINLNRLIDSINPKQIIADGSNYKSYTERWKQVCKKRKLPFHQTSKKGAFIIKY